MNLRHLRESRAQGRAADRQRAVRPPASATQDREGQPAVSTDGRSTGCLRNPERLAAKLAVVAGATVVARSGSRFAAARMRMNVREGRRDRAAILRGGRGKRLAPGATIARKGPDPWQAGGIGAAGTGFQGSVGRLRAPIPRRPEAPRRTAPIWFRTPTSSRPPSGRSLVGVRMIMEFANLNILGDRQRIGRLHDER